MTGCRIENCGKWDGIDVGIACVYLRAACTDCLIEDNTFLESNCAVDEDAYQVSAIPSGCIVRNNRSYNLRSHYIIDDASTTGALGYAMQIRNNSLYGHHDAPVGLERYGIRISSSIGAVVEENRIFAVASGIEILGSVKYASVKNNTICGFVAGAATISGNGIWSRTPQNGLPAFCEISGNRVFGAPGPSFKWDVANGFYIAGNLEFDSSLPIPQL